MPIIVGIVVILVLACLFGGSKSEDESFFRRRTFWERITGEEPTFIEKVENFFYGLVALFIIIAVLYFFVGFVLDELDIWLDVFDLLPRRRH